MKKKSSGVSNHYILDTLNKLQVSDLFMGVYSCNDMNIPLLKRKKEFILVANLSPKRTPGSHFVTIVKTLKEEVLYIDSLGQPSFLSKQLFDSLKSLGKKVTTLNRRPIQAADSVFCGIFTIYYSIFFDYKRFPVIKNQKTFLKKDLYKNDAICLHNIKKIIKLNPV